MLFTTSLKSKTDMRKSILSKPLLGICEEISANWNHISAMAATLRVCLKQLIFQSSEGLSKYSQALCRLKSTAALSMPAQNAMVDTPRLPIMTVP
jgi:hypothetical protein